MQQYIDVIAKDREVQELNNNISRVFSSLYPNPLLGNVNIIKGLTFISGTDLNILHKLGKTVAGFIVTNSNSAVNIFQSSTLNISPTTNIILKSNANSTVDVLFF